MLKDEEDYEVLNIFLPGQNMSNGFPNCSMNQQCHLLPFFIFLPPHNMSSPTLRNPEEGKNGK